MNNKPSGIQPDQRVRPFSIFLILAMGIVEAAGTDRVYNFPSDILYQVPNHIQLKKLPGARLHKSPMPDKLPSKRVSSRGNSAAPNSKRPV
nr:hypothetical protein [Nafulsella turpanensis]